MADNKNDGNCFICGKTVARTAAKNHILKEHSAGNESCALLRVEGDDKNYWLYADAAKEKTLAEVEILLRGIWLECCGHLAAFRAADGGRLSQRTTLGFFATGDRFFFDYDSGNTTTCNITVIGETKRPAQKKGARLLIRNAPLYFSCSVCNKPAAYVCRECAGTYLCGKCVKKHGHAVLSVTNSPRCGVCAYDGGLDTYRFEPGNYS